MKDISWIWVRRIAYLTILSIITVGLLTAAQISNSYLTSSGSGAGVSAVAMRDAASVLRDNRDAYVKVQKAIKRQQDRRVEALGMSSDATLYEYHHKVQFRRLVFGCYRNAYSQAKTKWAKENREVNELGWDFLLDVYSAAKDTGGQAPANCLRTVREGSDALAPLRSSGFDYAGVFKNCSGVAGPDGALECLWDNVTDSVGLQEIAQRHRSSLEAELATRRGALTDLDAELSSDKALADPSGRAAIAAWLELKEPKQTEPANPSRKAGGALLDWVKVAMSLPGQVIAFIAIMPLLAQSAFMAMTAGALGGGVAQIWLLLGYRRLEPTVMAQAAGSANELQQKLKGMLDEPATSQGLKDEIVSARAQLDDFTTALRQASEGLGELLRRQSGHETGWPMTVATFLGAVAALILWLLTTGGLFVLSGGDNVSSASPNVLLGLSLVAGLVHARVIDVVFSIAESVMLRGRSASARDAAQ